MRYELKSIGIWSVFKTSFIIFLVIGFMIGFLCALFFGFIISLSEMIGMGQMDEYDPDVIGFGLLLIVLPIMFAFGSAVFCTISNVFLAILYNLVRTITGGLEFNFVALESDSENKPEPIRQIIQTQATIAPVKSPAEFSAPPPPTTPADTDSTVDPPSKDSTDISDNSDNSDSSDISDNEKSS